MEEKVTILIIDDKPVNIYALKTILEKPGQVLLSETNGKDGLKTALANDVDLIILDVQMPGMDGFEVAQVLKSHKRTRDIPVIFASAEKKERQSIMKGFEEGAVDYLAKPLDPDLIRAKVAVLLKIQLQKKELIDKNASLEKAEKEISRLNADLQMNMVRLESMNKDLEAFSYSVSHDLRTPLRTLLGFSAILEEDHKDQLNEEAIRILRTIRQSANRMNDLINDLLEFAKLGKKEVVKSRIDGESIIRNTIEEITHAAPYKASFKLTTLHPMHADYNLLKQVWLNLISNALKYSSKKENPVIEIGSEKSDHEVIYYVKDNGAGFDMNYSDRLFGVFQRLHKTNDFEGTGVGLALAHRIISRHGGRIWAEAKVGEGATFYFSLPDVPG